MSGVLKVVVEVNNNLKFIGKKHCYEETTCKVNAGM
jgi:hypothetical protein